ncbi:hypothetical protein, partial [Lacticaseibacillus salsurivasis]|uniref:hypothetical protein n=1 Tax=Lacticaseibacillus salsurivasis TaxID=3081441 RepID=UPI0030C742E8
MIPSYKDSGCESFFFANLLHLNCKSVDNKKHQEQISCIIEVPTQTMEEDIVLMQKQDSTHRQKGQHLTS